MAKKRYTTKTARLSNGLRVLCVEAAHLSTAYVGLMFGVGSRHESARDNGLSHFLEHMVFRGTRSFGDVRDINAAAESIGGSIDAATYRDHTNYGTLTHPSKIDTALMLLSEIALFPKFKHLDTERTIIREEMRESFGARGQMIDVDTLMHARAYTGHPLGQPIEGVVDNVQRFSRSDMKRHLQKHYTAPNAVLVLAGQVSLNAVLPLVKKHFASMSDQAPTSTTTPGPRLDSPSFTWVTDPGAQVDLRLSFAGLSARDKDAAALSVLSRVLSEGLSSRLHSDLIDKKGLAYSLSAGPEMFADCGSYDFDVAVAPEKAVSTMKALLAFAKDAVKHPPTKTELRDAKDRYAIALDFMVDAPADLALWSARNTLQDIDPNFQRAADRFLDVTREECARVATRVFNQHALIAIGVGDLGKNERATLQKLVSSALTS